MANSLATRAVDAALKYTAYFEFAQVLRLALGSESNAEFQPFLLESDSAARDARYRRVWVLVTLFLGCTRYATYVSRSADVLKLALLVHLMEFGFFFVEFKNVANPTPKMKAFLALVTVLPTTMLLALPWYPRRADKDA